jgi:hypothetical protein
MKLMLTSTTGTPFKGFILQARQPDGSNSAIGQFTALPNLTKTFVCPGGHPVSSFMFLYPSMNAYVET